MSDCENCKAVKDSLSKLMGSNGFSMLGSNDTITCKQGHKVFA
jgi:hypothetical protein